MPQISPSPSCQKCYDTLHKEDPLRLVLKCNKKISHFFHKKCLQDYLEGQAIQSLSFNCPICKKDITRIKIEGQEDSSRFIRVSPLGKIVILVPSSVNPTAKRSSCLKFFCCS